VTGPQVALIGRETSAIGPETMLSIRPLPGFTAWIDGLKDEMVRGVVLKHFHFYSAQANVAKCVFS
jgi:hypothetical protein